MKYMLVLAAALLMTGAGAPAAQEIKTQMTMPDFSGEWVLDLDRSGFETDGEGTRRPGNPVTMIVKQDEKELVVTRTREGRGGEQVTTTLTYSLKGKKTKNKTEFGTMESTAKWIDEGRALELYSTTEVKRNGMKFTVENVQTWTLAGDVITIDTIRYTPRGEIKSTAVYERTGAEAKAEKTREKE